MVSMSELVQDRNQAPPAARLISGASLVAFGALAVVPTIYGFMMGIIRWRSGGIFWPWVARVFADIVIFTLVAAMIV